MHMMRTALVLAATALLAAGCGGGGSGGGGGNGQAGPGASAASCPPAPPRHAWAVEVSGAGQVLWRTALPASRDANALSPAVLPVLADGVVVAAQDETVHGLRPAGGRLLWSWGDGQPVYGMWRWQNLVAVLTGQVSAHAKLTALDAAAGKVRWSVSLPGNGVLGNAVATADGGLALVTVSGLLKVVSLASGKTRWSAQAGASPALAAAHGIVVFSMSGRATGYDDRTGRVRWRVTGLPHQAQVQVAGGLAVVTSAVAGGSAPTAMTAIVPGSGHVAWRFDTGVPLTLLGAGPHGLAVSDSDPAEHLYLVNPATGRPRWRMATAAQVQGGIPLVTATDVVAVEGRTSFQVVDRDARTGKVRWTVPAGQVVVPLVADGPLVLVLNEPAQPGQPASLHAYRLAGGGLAWQADLVTFVQTPLAAVPGGFLVQPADLGYACPSSR
jgi:outer membrane protein assembly factor BamB